MSDSENKPVNLNLTDSSGDFIGGRVFRSFRPARNKNGKVVYVPKLMDQFLVWNLPDDWNYLGDNLGLQEEIIERIADGQAVSDVAANFELPTSVILTFAKRSPEFRERIDEARRFRAEYYHDKLANIADDVTEFTAKSSKVKADIYRDLMEVGDRARFGAQQKVVQESNQTITFVVDTGIRRELPATVVRGEIIDARTEADDDEDLDGLPATPPSVVDPCETQAILSPCVPQEIREDGSVHQRACGPVPQVRETES